MQLSDTERRLGEAVASRAELAQDIEDLLLVATTDEDAEGFVTAYHFKTGALHRLLGKARQAMPAEWSVDSHLGAHPDNIPTPEGRLISATPKDRP
jgi:hypothetical protein